MNSYGYFTRVAIALDQLCNTLVGGSPDETLSARCWRCRARQPWKALRLLVDGLFFWQDAHCREAWCSEMARAQLPGSYRHREDGPCA